MAEWRKTVELSGGAPLDVAGMGHAYGKCGHRAEARKALRKLDQLATERYVSNYGRVLIWTGLGETDRALEALERAFDERSSWMVQLRVDSRLDPLRVYPRFIDLIRRVGLVP